MLTLAFIDGTDVNLYFQIFFHHFVYKYFLSFVWGKYCDLQWLILVVYPMFYQWIQSFNNFHLLSMNHLSCAMIYSYYYNFSCLSNVTLWFLVHFMVTDST